MNKISFKEIVNNSIKYRENEYIQHFFRNIADIKKLDPIYESFSDDYNVDVAIIKDSTSRILDNLNGKLMERTWRNCVFFYVDKESYIKHFGTNERYSSYVIKDDNVIFDGKYQNTSSKYPKEARIHWDIIKGFQDTIFNHFKKNHSSWFVRSYVYFVMVLCDKDSPITDKDFYVFYWNTNYVFKRITTKKNIFNNVSNSFFVESVENEIKLIETANRDVIECVKAYIGELDFRNISEENYYDISSDIDNGINYILVRGAARTGKTIIAMRILGSYKNSVFLIMNYYFFLSLREAFKIMDVEFPKKRIFHHDLRHRNDGGWIDNLQSKKIVPDLKFLIVDEAQRLAKLDAYYNYYQNYSLPGLDEIETIINCPDQKHTIFLGDDYQKLNPDYDKGFSLIYDKVKDKNFREYYFKNSIGIPLEVLDNIKYILDLPNGGQVQPTNEFTFTLIENVEEFTSLFDQDNTLKKHYVGIGLKQTKGQYIFDESHKIIEYPQDLKDNGYPYFFNDEVKSKYLLSTYEVISREIESVYLYIPNNVEFDKTKQLIRFSDDKYGTQSTFLINHLYTLMTRATLKLTIYCENEFLKEHFRNKIDYIHQLNLQSSRETSVGNTPIDVELDDNPYDYDLFIAYHGTNNPNGSYIKAKEICDKLIENGIRVFLNEHACSKQDIDLGFNETRNVIQRSNKFLLVFNDHIPRDRHGMIPRKYDDNKVNQLYSELVTFTSLVDDDLRNNKKQLKFFYDGHIYNRTNIYGFLNKLYRQGTTGNSNCCFFTFEEVLNFIITK